MIAAIIAASKDPTVNVAAVEAMANLAMKLQDRDLAAEFNRDLNAAIMEMPVITKAGAIVINDKDGNYSRTQGRYAKYEDIDRVVRPILKRHNLSIRFDVDHADQQITVCPILAHANGFTQRGGAMRVPLETSGSKNNTQGAGSAVSYGKRYTLCATLNIITEGTDDDGSLGKFAIDMPHERELLVLEGAEAAREEGRYQEWYDAQGVKDRGWLVTSGHHARLGGLVALPGAAAANAPQRAAQATSGPDVRTPEGWVEQYEIDCAAAPDRAALMRVQERGSRAMEKLKSQPKLHERATEAGRAAFARLSGGEG